MADNFRIKTPHAAVLIWNYIDRIGTDNNTSASTKNLNDTEKVIISTLSCESISTSKAKGQPEGTFQITLAPTKDWVSTLTAGSWLCILMSNEPITEADIQKANKSQVKMIGKIESVRAEVSVGDDGARQTKYYMSGVDWGHIFSSIVYVDNLIASKNDPTSLGNAAAVALRNALFGNGNTAQSFYVKDNLRSIINLFGQTLHGFEEDGTDINRLASALYNFKMPRDMVNFFSFVGPSGPTQDLNLNKVLNLKTGSLKQPDTYIDSKESKGFIDSFSLQGQHTFWQLLIENSNPVLNEMFPEMRWNMDDDSDNSLELTLYNRIKPFSYKGFNPDGGTGKGPKSYFQNCREHDIDNVEVISVNAGTNWRDKFNFIEVKPNFQDLQVFANWTKTKSQTSDPRAFEREGFRPLILETKQFPSPNSTRPKGDPDVAIDMDAISQWVQMMREWYFNTHRMLNGTLVIHGTTEYIGVGDNIKFDAALLNPTPNINDAVATAQSNNDISILAHVENISHSFGVSGDGARTYTTTIQFVRGIIVNGDNVIQGQGLLDKLADKVTINHRNNNTINTVSTSDSLDPDPQKLKGT